MVAVLTLMFFHPCYTFYFPNPFLPPCQARLFDCRSPSSCHKTWTFPAEVEKVIFDPFSPFRFLAATDEGYLYSIDCRQQKPVFTLAAHTDAVTAVDFRWDGLMDLLDGCMLGWMDAWVDGWIIAGLDKRLRLWIYGCVCAVYGYFMHA